MKYLKDHLTLQMLLILKFCNYKLIDVQAME